MSNTEKLTALADDIKAGFEREPWRDQPGMGYVEIQMDKDDEAEYRAMAKHIAELEAERDALAVVLQHLRPHAREMYVHIPKKGTVTLGWLMDQAGYREVVAARDARMKREGIVELLDDFLVVNMQEPVRADEDPRDALQRLIYWETKTLLDPSVSRPAKELKRQGALEALNMVMVEAEKRRLSYASDSVTRKSDREVSERLNNKAIAIEAFAGFIRAAIDALEKEGRSDD